MNNISKNDMKRTNGRVINSKSNKTFKNDITKSNYQPVTESKNSEKYFKCYSVKLNEFLKSHNLKAVKESRHSKTNKIAFIYEKNKELDELLTIWTNNKDKNLI